MFKERTMNYKSWLLFFFGTLFFSSLSMAQSEGVVSFSQPQESLRRESEEPVVRPVRQFVDSAGALAMKTIFEAEQAFCYEVFPQDPNYEGYTLNGFPLQGFCGVLNPEVRGMVSQSFFAADNGVDFGATEECVIQPKIILRFVRGVDYADVLLSSPCHAIAIFYGGSVSAYNFKPGADLIDAIVESLKARHQEFISPALLGQVWPIGVIQNAEQRKMINKKSEPIRKWEVKAKENVKKQEEEIKRQSTGWNKLKTRL